MIRVAVHLATLPERRELLETVTIPAYKDQGVETEIRCSEGGSFGACQNRLSWMLAADCDYLVVACDDQVPSLGCLASAIIHWQQHRTLPGERLWEQHRPAQEMDKEPGLAERSWTRIFFAPPNVYADVGAFLDLSWYVDIDYSQRIREAGYRIQVCDGFDFDHPDPPRGWATPAEINRQHLAYREACVAGGRSPIV